MRKFLLAIASVALVGCGGDSTGLGASVAGTWNLQTVNGSPLPYTTLFVAGPPLHQLELLSDTFVAEADGTYTEAFTSRETIGSTVTTTTDNSDGRERLAWLAWFNTEARSGKLSQLSAF